MTAGHAFVRPGQVDPAHPAPDNCMVCGLSEAAHRAEIAEVIAGRAILADWQRATHEYTVGTAAAVDWPAWALRLGQHLQAVLDGLGRARPAATVALPDGSAILAAADVATVRLALFHAARGADLADSAAYDALAARLGDAPVKF